jgi:hypothetical protein
MAASHVSSCQRLATTAPRVRLTSSAAQRSLAVSSHVHAMCDLLERLRNYGVFAACAPGTRYITKRMASREASVRRGRRMTERSTVARLLR